MEKLQFTLQSWFSFTPASYIFHDSRSHQLLCTFEESDIVVLVVCRDSFLSEFFFCLWAYGLQMQLLHLKFLARPYYWVCRWDSLLDSHFQIAYTNGPIHISQLLSILSATHDTILHSLCFYRRIINKYWSECKGHDINPSLFFFNQLKEKKVLSKQKFLIYSYRDTIE